MPAAKWCVAMSHSCILQPVSSVHNLVRLVRFCHIKVNLESLVIFLSPSLNKNDGDSIMTSVGLQDRTITARILCMIKN